MEEAEKILVVINPKSGGTDKKDLPDRIRQALNNKKSGYSFYETTGEDDDKKLNEKIDTIQPTKVLVAGGDGTVNMVAGLLANKNITLGILPMGSANGLAKELHIPENEKEALDIALGKNTKNIDAIALENHGLTFHLSDIGLNATLIKNYSDANEHGFFAYVKNSFKSLYSQPTFRIVLNNGKRTWRKKVYMLIIANARMYGTGIKINPKGSVNDGKFEVLMLRGINLRSLWKSLTGQKDLLHTIHTDYIKITTVEEMSFQIDGEYIGKVKEIIARIVPGCIPVAVAKS